MGSIFGYFKVNGLEFSDANLSEMSKQTSWYNPDIQFTFKSDQIILGQQNLKTHSWSHLESDNIFSHSSGLKIVSDSRLDNRAALKRRLNVAEDVANSELILLTFLKYGVSCSQYLLGAFAFAIWDPTNKHLFCARDHIGVKPFNYYFEEGNFIFGTQKKSITANTESFRKPNWRYIFNSMTKIGLVPDQTSNLFIKQLLPGHHLTIKINGGVDIKKYWTLDLNKRVNHKTDQDYIQEFNFHFKNAIECRLDSPKITASHLSGGLDSCGISAMANQICEADGKQLKFLSYNVPRDFDGDRESMKENLLAYDQVDFLNAEHKFINVEKPIYRSFRQFIEDETQSCDGRSKSNNVYVEYEIQATAQANDINVVLSGFPGDELVTSFCRPYYLEYFDRGEWWNYFSKQLESRHTFKDKSQALLALNASKLKLIKEENLRKRFSKWESRSERYNGYSKLLKRQYFKQSKDLEETLLPVFEMEAHKPFPRSLREYQWNHLNRSHTSKRMECEQLAGLRWHVEYRYPMTDIRLLQYVISIPMEQKISPDMNRKMFRSAMKGYIPDSIRLRDWKYAGNLKPMAELYPFKIENSIGELIMDFIDAKSIPFLNLKMVQKRLKEVQSPYRLTPWMILGQLGLEDKLRF